MLSRILRSRFGGLAVFAAVFLVVSLLLRIGLHVYSGADASTQPVVLAKTYLVGVLFDAVTLLCLLAPVALVLLLMPERLFHSRLFRVLTIIVYLLTVYALLFDVAAEALFWEEFAARFNFVAVDYLVYTQEVIGNIRQSYPVVWILAGLAVAAGGIVALTWRWGRLQFESTSTLRGRMLPAAVLAALAVGGLLAVDPSWAEVSANRYNNELARNGGYSFVQAFRDNKLDYGAFYITHERDAVFKRMRTLLAGDGAEFVSDDPADLTRRVRRDGPEKHLNVILVVVESLSAEFMGSFGSDQGLTPNLDALAGKGLLLTRLYATGTRTDRGLEALTLSLPPTPGRSLIKRPGNEGMFTLGQIFRRRGYDVKFLYGGYGYFDNMNAFFAGNGFATVDRAHLSDSEITFENAWGVCDGDLFKRTLLEADASAAGGKPFFSLVMTTSNHRPYTYPQVIDIPSGSGRLGAVKYTDHAIGQFIDEAARRPWFGRTVFVIVADHCANSAGKAEISVDQYHIPAIFHAPDLIAPRRVDTLASQIDLAPTLLGVLNFSYTSRFYGQDLLAGGGGRALLGNYQKVGLLVGDRLALLLPRKEARSYRVGSGGQTLVEGGAELLDDAVSYYQSAAWLLANHRHQAE